MPLGLLLIFTVFAGFGAALFFDEADVFWPDTGFVFGASVVLSVWGLGRSSSKRLHPLYLRGNAAIGMARLGVLAPMLFCAYVLAFHADPSVHYNIFWTLLYVLMAFTSIKLFGQVAAEWFGPRLRVDVYERKNLAAGTFIGAFTAATGMIFGGAMWGTMEAEALEYGAFFESLPGYEDGWWITPWFFLMGWAICVASLILWMLGEPGHFRTRIVRERRMSDARAAAMFCIAVAITITYAVSGEYRGFWDSLVGFGFVALPVLAHGVMKPRPGQERSRDAEGLVYIGLAILGVLITPWMAGLLGLTL
jgi:hypothetical protein